MNESLNKSFWKHNLIPSLLGGLVGVAITQFFAFYIFYKNFEITATKDRISDLKNDISLLRSAQYDAEINTKLLIGQEISEFLFDYNERKIDLLAIKDPAVREFATVFLGNKNAYYEVVNLKIPKRYLSDNGFHDENVKGELNSGLSKELTDFYYKINDINHEINTIKSIFSNSGRSISTSDLEDLKISQERFNADIKYIKEDKIVDINNAISDELSRLDKIKEKLGDLWNMQYQHRFIFLNLKGLLI